MRAVNATALISTGREKTSLNLSHAVGVTLHEQHAALEAAAAAAAAAADPPSTTTTPSLDGGDDDEEEETDEEEEGEEEEEAKSSSTKRNKKKTKAGRVASKSQRESLVEDLLEALDAVELRPPPGRPPPGYETSDVWGSRRATDRRALERVMGVVRDGDGVGSGAS